MRHLGGSFKYTLTFFSILYLPLLGTSMMPILRGTYFIWLFGCSKFATCTIPLHCAISLLSLTHVLTQYATKSQTSQSGVHTGFLRNPGRRFLKTSFFISLLVQRNEAKKRHSFIRCFQKFWDFWNRHYGLNYFQGFNNS